MKKRILIIICLLLACQFRLNAVEVEWKTASGEIEIKAVNGTVPSVTVLKGNGRVKGCAVKVRKPSCLRLRFDVQDPVTVPGPNSTIISVVSGAESFSFFLRDVNAASPIWIPEYQVVVLPDGVSMSYDEVVESVKSRHLVSKMDRIEQEEEASFEEAEKVTRNMSVPIWLGISRDIRRFEITEELPDALSTYQTDKTVVPTMACSQIVDESISPYPLSYNYSFGRGVGAYDNITRSLEDGVLPIYISVTEDDDAVYQSKSFVTLEKSILTEENVKGTHFMVSDKYSVGRSWTEAQQKQLDEVLKNTPPAGEETVLVIHTVITNKGGVPRYAWMKIPYASHRGVDYSYDSATGFSSFKDGRIFCASLLGGKPVPNDETAVLLQPGESMDVDYFIFHSPVSASRAEAMAKRPYEELYAQCKAFWQKKLDAAAKIHVPEERIDNMLKAGLLHLDLITYGDRDQGTLAPNVGVYSPIGTESAPIIQYYESLGLTGQARRCLQYFLDTQQEDGRIVNFFGYTIETGAVLWSIGEYYRYTKDRQWIEQNKAQILKACDYLLEWRKRNLKEEFRGRGYGMIDGKVADPVDPFHQFMLNGYSYLGLKRVSEVLEEIGAKEARPLAAEAKAWRQDILDSFHACLASSPVVPISDGSWCPTCSPWAESPTARFFLQKAEQYRSHGTFMAPDGLLGPLHLVFTEVIDPQSRDAALLLKYYRDVICQDNTLFSQPYYGKHNIIQARLGQVKPFLNTYYYTVAPHFDHSTGTFWEHYFKVSVHKTHEEANFLMETRQMLYLEDGDTLKLLSVIPRRWLKDGKEIVLDSVLSYFGRINLDVTSNVAKGEIRAHVSCPDAGKPSAVTVRLPHPDGIKAAKVSGGSYDSATETVTVTDFPGEANIVLYF
jgi:hypothetical protein